MSSNEAPDVIAEGNDDDMPENTHTDMAYDVPVSSSNDQIVLHPEIGFYESLINNLLADGYQMCIDLCGVDYFKNLTRKLPNDATAELWNAKRVTCLVLYLRAILIQLQFYFQRVGWATRCVRIFRWEEFRCNSKQLRDVNEHSRPSPQP